MKTAIVQIGNSDDKLTQYRWSQFFRMTDGICVSYARLMHFTGCSPPQAKWQNACWVFEIKDVSIAVLRSQLSRLATNFGQDNIALTIGETELVAAMSTTG